MSNISNYLKTKIINETIRGTVYVALYTTSPTDADIGIEVTGGSYVRMLGTFGVDVLGVTKNTLDIEFPPASADWGTITYIGIRDALTGGNLLYYADLTTPRNITTDTQLVLSTGQVELTLS